MKSCVKNLTSSKGVMATVRSVIQEWEDWSEEVGSFEISTSNGCVFYLNHLNQKQGSYKPYLEMAYDGSIKIFKLEDRVVYHGIRFAFGFDGSLNNCWYRNIGSARTPYCLSSGMGVEDLLNLQPHEFGFLKLKYGITKDLLFIPSIVKDQI